MVLPGFYDSVCGYKDNKDKDICKREYEGKGLMFLWQADPYPLNLYSEMKILVPVLPGIF
jgi:hypothetical protein